jgi:hypothetical protein
MSNPVTGKKRTSDGCFKTVGALPGGRIQMKELKPMDEFSMQGTALRSLAVAHAVAFTAQVTGMGLERKLQTINHVLRLRSMQEPLESFAGRTDAHLVAFDAHTGDMHADDEASDATDLNVEIGDDDVASMDDVLVHACYASQAWYQGALMEDITLDYLGAPRNTIGLPKPR